MRIVGWRSGIVIVILTFAIIFPFMYSSFQLNYRLAPHDPNTIPTMPKISQEHVINIVEREYRKWVPEYQEAYLHFHYYNYSYKLDTQDEDYQKYLRSLGAGWSFSHVEEKPELLSLRLMFIHANGTQYVIDYQSQQFEKVCDNSSSGCSLIGTKGAEAARDRLVYEVGAIAAGSTGFNQDVHYLKDAETGTIVFHTPYIEQRPVLPRTVLDNGHTIKELNRIIENTKQGTAVEIVQNASQVALESGDSKRKGYDPPEIMEIFSNATRIVWFNYDSTGHTVTSDNDYTDLLGKKFDSGIIAPGKNYEFVFIDTGHFAYHCEIHPWMTGKIDIRENFA
jgi:plastocyanin